MSELVLWRSTPAQLEDHLAIAANWYRSRYRHQRAETHLNEPKRGGNPAPALECAYEPSSRRSRALAEADLLEVVLHRRRHLAAEVDRAEAPDRPLPRDAVLVQRRRQDSDRTAALVEACEPDERPARVGRRNAHRHHPDARERRATPRVAHVRAGHAKDRRPLTQSRCARSLHRRREDESDDH